MTYERRCKLQLSEARELASFVGFLPFSPFSQLPGHRACFVKDSQEKMRENSFHFIRLDEIMCLGEGCPCVGVGRAAVAHAGLTEAMKRPPSWGWRGEGTRGGACGRRLLQSVWRAAQVSQPKNK